MSNGQTAIIAILVIIGIILFALGGFIIGTQGINFSSGDNYENSLMKNLQDENARLKVSNDKLQEQILLIQAENNRIREIKPTNVAPPLTFIRDTYEDRCDDIDDDIDETRDDIDRSEDKIEELEAKIALETDPVKKAALQAQLDEEVDDLEDLEDDLEDLYDDEDDENC